jgi:hypothetical protein
MKVIRVSGVLVLLLVLVCGFQGLAEAQLLKKTTQMVNISTNTLASPDHWTQVLPDGTTTAFSIPPKKALVINSFTLRFTPSETTTGPLRLLIMGGDPANPTLFFAYNLSQNKDGSGNVVSANLDFNFNPGLAIGVNPIIKIIVSNPQDPNTGSYPPGIFGMRIFGIIS